MTVVVDTTAVLHADVPQAVAGQTMPDRGTSASFSAGSPFRTSVSDFFVAGGAVRWPVWDGENNRKWHWDEPHTYGGTDFAVADQRDFWTYGYVLSNAGNNANILTLAPFMSVVAALGLVPQVVVNWSSPYVTLDGVHYNRDPLPKDINDVPLDSGVAAAMTGVDMIDLSNKRLLKNLVNLGAPDGTIISVGGEDWGGWGTLVPWATPDNNGVNKHTWIAQTREQRLQVLKTYAASQGWTRFRWMVNLAQGLDSSAPLPLSSGQVSTALDHATRAVNASGGSCDYVGVALPYRGDLTKFLSEDELVFSFFTPEGSGTLSRIRSYFQSLCTTLGFPSLPLILTETSVGAARNSADTANLTVLTQFQQGLAAVQYLIEVIRAGFPRANAHVGFMGDNRHAGLDPQVALTGSTSQAYNRWPMWYALSLFGAGLSRGADVFSTTSSHAKLPHLAMRWVEGGSVVIGVLLLNKDVQRTVPLDVVGPFGIALKACRRYSSTETTAPAITAPITVNADGTVDVLLAAQSVTYLEFYVVGPLGITSVTVVDPGDLAPAMVVADQVEVVEVEVAPIITTVEVRSP
jgi:hypothetical protein